MKKEYDSMEVRTRKGMFVHPLCSLEYKTKANALVIIMPD